MNFIVLYLLSSVCGWNAAQNWTVRFIYSSWQLKSNCVCWVSYCENVTIYQYDYFKIISQYDGTI